MATKLPLPPQVVVLQEKNLHFAITSLVDEYIMMDDGRTSFRIEYLPGDCQEPVTMLR